MDYSVHHAKPTRPTYGLASDAAVLPHAHKPDHVLA
jgi:hypothetical protein